jgi:hypothetical protein
VELYLLGLCITNTEYLILNYQFELTEENIFQLGFLEVLFIQGIGLCYVVDSMAGYVACSFG